MIGCKNEPMLYDVNKSIDINEIKSDFIKRTGYRQSDSSFINPSFKSVINWNTFYEVGLDTLYIKVNVADRLEISISKSKRILLNDNVWIRGTKKNDKWQYSVLTFIPSSNKREYSGIIISKSLQNMVQNVSFYEANVKVPVQLVKRAGKAPAMPTDCIYGYVNGVLNEISCPGGSGDDDGNDNPPYSGDPRDYQNIPPLGDGGSGGNSDGTVPTYTSDEDKEIIDSLQGYPCAQEVLKKLPNLENRISAWLNKVFNNTTENNITFRVSTKLGSKVDGAWNTNNAIGSTQTISLNADMLSKASQEYIAATMFHEALHGYLFMEKKRLEAEGKTSQFGILYPGFSEVSIESQPRFVKKHQDFGTQLKDLAAAIRTFAPTLSEYDAMALAKGGVVSDMSSVEKSANYNHREGSAGTRCTTK